MTIPAEFSDVYKSGHSINQNHDRSLQMSASCILNMSITSNVVHHRGGFSLKGRFQRVRIDALTFAPPLIHTEYYHDEPHRADNYRLARRVTIETLVITGSAN